MRRHLFSPLAGHAGWADSAGYSGRKARWAYPIGTKRQGALTSASAELPNGAAFRALPVNRSHVQSAHNSPLPPTAGVYLSTLSPPMTDQRGSDPQLRRRKNLCSDRLAADHCFSLMASALPESRRLHNAAVYSHFRPRQSFKVRRVDRHAIHESTAYL